MHSWERCPKCGDHNIEGEGFDVREYNGGYYADQSVSCAKCGASWVDTYMGVVRVVD